MTIDEKLQHFYEVSVEEAKEDAAKAIHRLSRPDAPTVPIIALSANAFAEDIQKSKNAGINEHLAKPLEMDKVLKVIASYCK